MSAFLIKTAPGSRACEQLLLEDLAAITSPPPADPAQLLPPATYLVVPSNSLRDHLLLKVLAHQNGALINFRCLTHFEMARHLLEGDISHPAVEQHFLGLYARRAARREAILDRSLGQLKDGFGTVIGTVRDLLDAGFQPAHADALHDVLSEEAHHVATKEEIARAHSMVRIAQTTAERFAGLNLKRPPDLLREATDALLSVERKSLNQARLLLYGYADATGLVTDFLIALLRSTTGRIYLSFPESRPESLSESLLESRPEPRQEAHSAHPENSSSTSPTSFSSPYGRSLRERLEPFGTRIESRTRVDEPQLSFFRALGPEAECRGVADRIRQLLDSGVTPEIIGVLARDMTPYQSPLRRQFMRLGIPFSGVGLRGPRARSGNAIAALQEILGAREQTRVDRWLDALGGPLDGARMFDLKLALSTLGASRLAQVRHLAQSIRDLGDSIALPVRTGIVLDSPANHAATARQDPPSASRIRLPHRQVTRASLQTYINSGVRLLDAIEGWTTKKKITVAEHLESLQGLLLDHLAWNQGNLATREVLAALAQLRTGYSAPIQISYEEFVLLLREVLSDLGKSNFGGAGAGVQVLDVMQARGCTFGHLYLLGMNRGAFPRQVQEDPFLPDSIRRVIARSGAGVLPDLQLKLAGIEEERFLFDQVLSSSPKVTVSWQDSDADTKPLSLSPLLERLRSGKGDHPLLLAEQVVAIAHPLSRQEVDVPDGTQAAPRPAFETAVQAGLINDTKNLAAVFQLAAEEWEDLSGTNIDLDATQLARARVAIIHEVDPPHGGPKGETAWRRLSPYYGQVGPPRSPLDPRQSGQKLFITTLEGVAHCPWQTFLTRLLRIEPLPDPLGELPHFDKALIGTLVHKVLERIVGDASDLASPTLDDVIAAPSKPIQWPTDAALHQIILQEGHRALRRKGIAVPGMARLLVSVIEPYLKIAHETDWPTPSPSRRVTVAEVRGHIGLLKSTPGARNIYFKADRADFEKGQLQLTDYKTGALLTGLKTAATRRKHLLRDVGSGQLLQAAGYAAAEVRETRQLSGPAESTITTSGRYLVLHPGDKGQQISREVLILRDDSEVATALENSLKTLVHAWDAGTFFPRLVDAKSGIEPRRCQYCSVSQACLRGDSGARLRLSEWISGRNDEQARSHSERPWEEAMLQAWFLGVKSMAEPSAIGESA